jgi:hypothetical protein
MCIRDRQCIALIFSYSKGAFYSDEIEQLIIQLLKIYSIPFGVIIGGIFGQKALKQKMNDRSAFIIAVSLSVIWNLLLVFRTITFVFASQDSVTVLLNYLNSVSAGGMFLIGGSLCYYFAKQ